MVDVIYYYVYYSYEEWGRGYIGSRECRYLPEEDLKYFGSFTDKTFKPTQKIILQTYKSRKEALEDEVKLHNFYQVDKNPHFANRAKQTSSGFYFKANGQNNPMFGKKLIGKNNPMFGKPSIWRGKTLSKKTREKMSKAAKGKKNGFYGKKHSEETKQKMSKSARGRIVSEKTKKILSKKLKNRIFSEKTKQKISLSKQGKYTGKNNPFFGKTHSEESKKKMSKSRKGPNGPIYGRRWFTNGVKDTLSFECPLGFKPGRSRISTRKVATPELH
jgi:hypothetical protein